LLTLGLVILALIPTSYWLVAEASSRSALTLHLTLLGVALVMVIGLVAAINREYRTPLSHLRNWAQRIQNGSLSARIPVTGGGEFGALARDINALGGELERLSRDMQSQVRKQTLRIADKTKSLEVLYDVAASINTSRDLDDLLTRFLHRLMDVVAARAAVVRLTSEGGQMRLVASVGLDEELLELEARLPHRHCLCGSAVERGEVMCHENLHQCNQILGRPFFESENIAMIAVPLQYRDQVLGVYNLFVEDQTIAAREDIQELLTSIGRHLGMAIEKTRLDEESHRLSIVKERTLLAHELHDSLAQTLASLRFQTRVLDEALHQGQESIVWRELERVEDSLEQANRELRELITHFRAPLDTRGVVPSIQNLVERFKDQTGIRTLLQEDWGSRELPRDIETQVVRIVQEALANIRKHSHAQHVRIRLKGDSAGQYSVLVEDDGTGITPRKASGGPGEHIGLTVMQERAEELDGKLHIESEPEEGTRVSLKFRYPRECGVEVKPIRQAVS
jgi:two-component system nitrate/nitrite sensor histidine kinase NarX